MTQIQASRATQASLQAPFHIRYSIVALIFVGVFVSLLLLMLSLFLGVGLANPDKWATYFQKPLVSATVALLIAEPVSIWLFYTRVIRPWLNLRKPVITISLAGIALRGGPVLPWREITANRLRTVHSGSGPSFSILELRTADGRKRRLFFSDLRINAEDYFRLCELYEAESEQLLQVAAAD